MRPLWIGCSSRPERGWITQSCVGELAFVGSDLQVSWGGLALYLGIVLGASAILYHGFEKPAQRWLNARAPAFARFKPATTPP